MTDRNSDSGRPVEEGIVSSISFTRQGRIVFSIGPRGYVREEYPTCDAARRAHRFQWADFLARHSVVELRITDHGPDKDKRAERIT